MALLHSVPCTGPVGGMLQHVRSIPVGCLGIQRAMTLQQQQQGHQQQAQQQQAQQQQAQQQQGQQQQGQQLQASCHEEARSGTSEYLLQAAHSVFMEHRGALEELRASLKSGGDPSAARLLVIGTGGTLTTLAALRLGLTAYDRNAVHHTSLTEEDVAALLHLALQQPDTLLSQHPWLSDERAASLAAGAAGVLVLMRALNVHAVLVSDADILDGALQELQQGRRPADDALRQ